MFCEVVVEIGPDFKIRIVRPWVLFNKRNENRAWSQVSGNHISVTHWWVNKFHAGKMTISFSSQKWLDLLNESLGEKMDLHKFAPCKHVAKMQKLRSKSRTKMINATFACQIHRIVNKEANVEFAIFSPIPLKFP